MLNPVPTPVPHWRQSTLDCPRFWRGWLLDTHSLTRRLQRHSQGDFSVAVLHQAWGKPRRDEAQALGIPTSQSALIREVVLKGYDEPWVFARSVMPLQALNGKLRFLQTLGNRPLGELLFSNPAIRRGPIWLSRWPEALLPDSVRHDLTTTQGLLDAKALWARYSVFRHDQAGILVSEVFLPALASRADSDNSPSTTPRFR